MNEEKPKGVIAKPVEPAELSWLEHLWKTEQEIPNRIEDAAKFLATMVSVSFSVFLAVGKERITDTVDTEIQAAMVVWIVSLFFSFLVLFPFRYKIASDSVELIRKTHRKIAIVKRTLLTISLVLFLTALLILVNRFFF